MKRARKAKPRVGRPPKKPEDKHVKVLLALSPELAARLDSLGPSRQDTLRRLIVDATPAGLPGGAYFQFIAPRKARDPAG